MHCSGHRSCNTCFSISLGLMETSALLAAAVLFLLGHASLTMADAAAPSCGSLQGSCNSRVCCCSSSGLLVQKPTDQGTCRWEASSGVAGAAFLMAAAIAPAILLLCVGGIRTKSLRLKPAPPLAQLQRQ